MSDFINGGWAMFVTVIVIASLIFCVFVLIAASKRTVMADDNSTGHVWDGDLKEMNNPLPRWWMGLFVLTVAFAALYLVLYPGLGGNQGTLGWSSKGQLETENAKARETMAPVYAAFTNMSAEEMAKNPQAMAIGERLFATTCSQCHGSDARGSKSFPNLTDNDWLGGSGPEYIAKTIKEGRQGVMPVMAGAVGTPEDVRNVANYVLSLSGSPHNSVAAQLGKPKFAACAACHGPDGKGNQAIGAPNLTDKTWLHGWGEAAVMSMVNNGKTNVMPPQGARLTPEQIKVLAAYVWNLSQSTKVAAK
jgi:cytochrome c oxidase cbb3-type subunit 3